MSILQQDFKVYAVRWKKYEKFHVVTVGEFMLAE